jgi:arsenate reductase
MKRRFCLTLVSALVVSFPTCGVTQIQTNHLRPEVLDFVEKRVSEFEKIPEARKNQLKKLTAYLRSQTAMSRPIKLTFICTHNSRRSHLSQVWAAIAAEYYGVKGVETYSGGTEATAFNPRAIAALERAGLAIKQQTEGKNPKYEVQYRLSGEPLTCFSKVYHEAPNPVAGFCAVMTCTQADQNCPNVLGATVRIAIPFEDPKVSDNTPQEKAVYDERCQQISRELLYAFSQSTR